MAAEEVEEMAARKVACVVVVGKEMQVVGQGAGVMLVAWVTTSRL